jgi:predicted enzyme related to lactoylglutathione lyase
VLRIGNVTFDCEQPQRLAEFWAAVTGYAVDQSSPHFARLVPQADSGPNLLFIKVPEPRSGKNRVHVDLRGDDMEAEIYRLVDLGATEGEFHSEHGVRWTVMADPEGNEFCIAG